MYLPDYTRLMGFAQRYCRAMAYFRLGANSPFDKLRANEKACLFALSLSKGEFTPQTDMNPRSG
jgi:hypothetical protein